MGLFAKNKKKQPINHNLAYSAVILANPLFGRRELTERLIEAKENKGYDFDLHLRSYPNGIVRAKAFDSFLNRLEMTQYIEGHFVSARSSFTPSAIELLERKILKEFERNPQVTREFVEVIGLDLDPILQKYVSEYLGIVDPDSGVTHPDGYRA